MIFSRDNALLVVYLDSIFWENILKQYNSTNLEKIKFCYHLGIHLKNITIQWMNSIKIVRIKMN